MKWTPGRERVLALEAVSALSFCQIFSFSAIWFRRSGPARQVLLLILPYHSEVFFRTKLWTWWWGKQLTTCNIALRFEQQGRDCWTATARHSGTSFKMLRTFRKRFKMLGTFWKRFLIIWETESYFNLQLQSEFRTPKTSENQTFLFPIGKCHQIVQTFWIQNKKVRHLGHSPIRHTFTIWKTLK